MTREEIIKEYEAAVAAHAAAAAAGIKGAEKSYELFKAGLDALRPVSREQVEKVWRGKWLRGAKDWVCSRCGRSHTFVKSFCPNCGAPMTDEAVDILLKRLEAQKDELSRLQAP